MTDISKCTGTECPIKETCYRYTASASEYQSYIVPPWDKETKTCEMFLTNHSHTLLDFDELIKDLKEEKK